MVYLSFHNMKEGRINSIRLDMKMKWWAVLVIAAISFYFGNMTATEGDGSSELVVPETPNYTVKQGDTLSKIALRLVVEKGMDINEAIQILKDANEQKGNEIQAIIYPGQDIYIPTYQN